jgi:hypothetical protein
MTAHDSMSIFCVIPPLKQEIRIQIQTLKKHFFSVQASGLVWFLNRMLCLLPSHGTKAGLHSDLHVTRGLVKKHSPSVQASV